MEKKLIILITLLVFCVISCNKQDKNPEQVDFNGLIEIVQKRNTKKLELIFSKKVNLSSDQEKFLLEHAIDRNYDVLFFLLIDNGMDVNIFYKNEPILIYLIKQKRYVTAQLLINKGADLFLKDTNGNCAFTLGMKSGFKDLQKILIDYFVNTDYILSQEQFKRNFATLSQELMSYLVEVVLINEISADKYAMIFREVLEKDYTILIDKMMEHKDFNIKMQESKITPYILSQLPQDKPYSDNLMRLKNAKLVFDKSEPYIQDAISTGNFDSIPWLVNNGASWKEELEYYGQRSNVIDFIYLQESLVGNGEESRIISEELSNYLKYFKKLIE